MAFPERLLSLRKERRLTQLTLAEATGISTSAIAMYERGERRPSLENLEILTDYFNVDTAYILGESDIRRAHDFEGVAEHGITSEDVNFIVQYKNAPLWVREIILTLLSKAK